MRTKTISITQLPSSPDADRHARMIRYSVAMGIRMICILLCIVIPDWWRLIPAVGAIVLPYFAVIIANNASRRMSGPVRRPGSVVLAAGANTSGGAKATPPDEDAA